MTISPWRDLNWVWHGGQWIHKQGRSRQWVAVQRQIAKNAWTVASWFITLVRVLGWVWFALPIELAVRRSQVVWSGMVNCERRSLRLPEQPDCVR
jgi:hypothetical protein